MGTIRCLPGRRWRGLSLWLACGGLGACHSKVLDFSHDDTASMPDDVLESRPACAAGTGWLPSTPAVPMQQADPHPAPECPFYRGAFQNFLIATQPDPGTGEAALTAYASVDDIFDRTVPLPAGALAAAGAHRGTSQRAWLGDVRQAGSRQLLIDQDGHSLYYGIHVNRAFTDFVDASGLRSRAGVLGADPALTLPPGIVTLQSAWKDIDPADGVTGDYSDYITTTAWVSRLSQSASASSAIEEDKAAPRQIKVALVALHVAYTLPGHAEMIWSTFEHTDEEGNPDLAPVVATRPIPEDPLNLKINTPVSNLSFALYGAGMPTNQANRPYSDLDLQLDAASQSFAQRTSIYRAFPGSRSHSDAIDPEVTTLNRSVAALFAASAGALSPDDKRGHYRLVGAIWVEKAAYFRLNSMLQNDGDSPFLQPGGVSGSDTTVPLAEVVEDFRVHGTDSQYSILGGQDRLTGVATESFVQPPGSFNNCLICHNTTAPTVAGIPLARDSSLVPVKLLDAKRIGVSHVFSAFLLTDGMAP